MAAKRKRAQETIRAYRQRMQRKGFRQINLWVPDTRAPEFVKECRRQSRLASTTEPSEIDELLAAAARSVDGWT